MSKSKTSFKSKLNSFVATKTDLKVENEKVFCMVCVKPINVNPSKYMCRISEHLSSDSHKRHRELKIRNDNKLQTLLTESFDKSKEKADDSDYFITRLTEALITSNIPLNNLSKKPMIDFLEEFTQKTIPHESTIRKRYLPLLYEKTIKKIRQTVGFNYVYFIVDETTDVCGRKVFNTLVGVLNGEYSPPMLVDVKFVEDTKHSTIQKAFLDSCQTLWPNGIPYDKVLLLVSDAATYMISAGNILKTFFTDMAHITCVVHALDRVCRKVESNSQKLNQFISSMKKYLLTSKTKQLNYRDITGLPLPPVPCLTRWKTWLETALFYSENLDLIRLFVADIKPNLKNKSSLKLKKLINEEQFLKELSTVSQFKVLIESIDNLLISGHKLSEQKDTIDNTLNLLNGFAKEKLTNCLSKNKDLSSFCENQDMAHLKTYAPITSVAVERSFSLYKNILTDRRHRFTDDNIKFHIICQYNSFLNE